MKNHLKNIIFKPEETEDKETNLELSKSPVTLTSDISPTDFQEKYVIQKEVSLSLGKSDVGDKIARPVFPYRVPILIKKNAATILREASRVIIEEEKEIQRLHELVNGALDSKQYEQLEEENRAIAKTEELQKIQRKHLLGLLSREEAIIAKHKLLQANKAKKAQIDKEKNEAKAILDKITLEHNEQAKKIVEKTQQIQKNIIQKKNSVLCRKQKEAQEVADINKHIYQKYILQQKEELEEKIKIIKQIKELSSIKDINGNKFDPTETTNEGLLCEMSLNELKERLLLNKVRLKDEIEHRRKSIMKQKVKHQLFLKDTQKFIDDCRDHRKKVNTREGSINLNFVDSPDVIELREKLLAAKSKRVQLECNGK